MDFQNLMIIEFCKWLTIKILIILPWGPYRLSCFDIYCIQTNKQTNRHPNLEAKYLLIDKLGYFLL